MHSLFASYSASQLIFFPNSFNLNGLISTIATTMPIMFFKIFFGKTKFHLDVIDSVIKHLLLTIDDLCEILMIGKNLAYRLLAEKKIRAFRGKSQRLPLRTIWLKIPAEKRRGIPAAWIFFFFHSFKQGIHFFQYRLGRGEDSNRHQPVLLCSFHVKHDVTQPSYEILCLL